MNRTLTAVVASAALVAGPVLVADPALAAAKVETVCDAWFDADNSALVRGCTDFKGYKGNLYSRLTIQLKVTSSKAGVEKRYIGPRRFQFRSARGSTWCNSVVVGSNEVYYLKARKGHPATSHGAWIKLKAGRHQGPNGTGACKGSGNPHHGKIWWRYTFGGRPSPATHEYVAQVTNFKIGS
jgi:hypothetical protein